MAEENKELKNYTRIFNPILEALCMQSKNLTSSDYAVLLCVIRTTYGWKRKKHPMSISYIAQATGMNERTVKRSVKNLIKKRFLIDYGNDKKFRSKVLGLNKKYSQWNAEGVTDDTDNSCNLRVTNDVQMMVTNEVKEGVTDVTQQIYKNKDSKNKDKNKKDMSPKKTIFLSSSGVPYTEIDDEGFGYWKEKNGAVRWEPITEGKKVEK